MSGCTKLMRIASCAVVAAFLFTIAASAAPALHDALHRGDAASHVCAVTLVSAGNVDLAGPVPLVLAFSGPAETVAPVDAPLRLARTLFFARLEHAPPSFS